MKIEIEKSLALPVSAATGWGLVENIEDIATCLPGAKITERVDATHYKGTVTVKLGPATVSFKGEIEIVSLDPAGHKIRLVGRGSDTTGTSGASLDLTATVVETGAASCELSGRSEVSVTGKVAAFGARLMNTVTDQLLKIFFANILARAQALEAARPAAATVEEVAAAPPPSAPVAAPAAELNALSFIWAVIKAFLGGLFGRTKAG
jgi:carbon monoxide dehydrogenase subunit G